MAKYIVVSPRVGTPGEPYEPEVWVNLQHLLDNGFIRRADEPTNEPAPAPRVRVSKKTKPDTETTE